MSRFPFVAGRGREWPGYKLTAILVNPDQWKAGVRDLKDLKGKRIGITQFGFTFHYMLGNVLEQKGMTMNDVKIVTLGSVSSMRDTLISKQIESAFLVQPFISPLENDQKANVLLGSGIPFAISWGESSMERSSSKTARRTLSFMKGYIRSADITTRMRS